MTRLSFSVSWMTWWAPLHQSLAQGGRRIEKLTAVVRISFKPSKSRSFVLKKGKVVGKFSFTISENIIPTLKEQPVKSLGKLFDFSLKDKTAIHKIHREALRPGEGLTNLGYLPFSRLEYTSMPSCPGYYVPCYCMTFPCQLWKP